MCLRHLTTRININLESISDEADALKNLLEPLKRFPYLEQRHCLA